MHTYIVKDDATCMMVTIRLSRELPFSLEPIKCLAARWNQRCGFGCDSAVRASLGAYGAARNPSTIGRVQQKACLNSLHQMSADRVTLP